MKCFNRKGELKVATNIGQFLFEGAPKVQDDTDNLWRWLRSTTINGVPTLYLSQSADTTPGREAIVQDDVDGLYRKVRSTTINGEHVLYLEDYP
jgi:hypothetical protein